MWVATNLECAESWFTRQGARWSRGSADHSVFDKCHFITFRLRLCDVCFQFLVVVLWRSVHDGLGKHSQHRQRLSVPSRNADTKTLSEQSGGFVTV